MNIAFMGTPDFAVPSLKALLSSPHKIVAVVTAEDRPQGRGLKISESPVKKVARQKNLKILQPESLKDEAFINELKSLSEGAGLDLIIVVAFKILPKEVFTIPKFGSFNLHASLLPKYRGAAPVNWALINGEKETGVTTFFLKEKVDTGNIIMQYKCEIANDDDAGTLHNKLAELGAKTVISTVNLIESSNGKVPVYPQEESLATPAPKIHNYFCKVNWNNSSSNIYNFIRGLSPYPAAFTTHRSNRLKLFKSRVMSIPGMNLNDRPEVPGEIKIIDNALFVNCEQGYLEIIELQLEGKKRMTADEFLRGYKIESGDRFES
ncbi:MAG: methionyl-tRNA formyltransferase [Ignavibacteria bacterium]